MHSIIAKLNSFASCFRMSLSLYSHSIFRCTVWCVYPGTGNNRISCNSSFSHCCYISNITHSSLNVCSIRKSVDQDSINNNTRFDVESTISLYTSSAILSRPVSQSLGILINLEISTTSSSASSTICLIENA